MCVLVLTLACGAHYEHLVERQLPAPDELSCGAFLAWNHEPVRDAFLIINGSGTLSNAFVHPSFQDLLDTRRVAYSTYDKPGIRAPFADPAALHRDDALLQRYTLGHGVACATGALGWAREQLGPSVRLHVRGHSEGTLVALYAYDALLDSAPELAAGIASFVLSGLALEPFEDILARQLTWLPDAARLRQALAACDWTVLGPSLGVSCAYIDDAKGRPSGRAMFERLAARARGASGDWKPGARFHIFHGTNDKNTPVAPVRELERWNGAEGHLPIEFHYYEGAHAGNDAGRAAVAKVLAQLIAE
jgi:hypothetical protein